MPDDEEIQDHIDLVGIFPPNWIVRSILRRSIAAEGCRETILLWRGSSASIYVADGHYRLAICRQLGVPYKTRLLPYSKIHDVFRWRILRHPSRVSLPHLVQHPNWHQYREHLIDLFDQEDVADAQRQLLRGALTRSEQGRKPLKQRIADLDQFLALPDDQRHAFGLCSARQIARHFQVDHKTVTAHALKPLGNSPAGRT